jgi:diguanylate cyclase (GGDEF)-like protein/PAS domain S-box-containing protein
VRIFATATLGAAVMLIAGLVGACSPLTAVAVAASVAAVPVAVSLLSRGLAIHAASRSMEQLQGACRCSGMLGLGTLVSGLTAAALPLVGPGSRAAVATVGMMVASAPLMIGLLHLPGVGGTAGRVRHGLDGLIIGISVALVGWLLAPGLGVEHPTAYVAASVAASCAAITVATLLRATQRWPAAASCGGGAALAVVGLALLVVALSQGAPRWWLLAAATLVVAAPPLVWAGARQANPLPPLPPLPLPQPGPDLSGSRPPRLDELFGGYPMLALPVGAVVLATAYHLLAIGRPDHTALLLGTVMGGLLAVREIPAAAELRRCARVLSAQEAHLRALVTGTSDVTLVLGDQLVVKWQSPAGRQQLGLADQDVVGRRFTALLHPDDVPAVADRLRVILGCGADPTEPALLLARVRDGKGAWRETESTVSDLRQVPEVAALVVQLRDVGQRRALERKLERLTSCDQLTGLPNRRELLRAITARRGAGHRSGVLLIIDLAGFCAVNDRQGRAAGDAVLLAAAQRLTALADPDDLVSRLGECQFAIVTAQEPVEAYTLGFRVLAELGRPYDLASGRVQLIASVGLSTVAGGEDADEVVRRGDLALRRAMELGQSRIDWYDEAVEQHLVRRLDLERHLPGATGRGELDLVYQPIVELAGERPVGVEALLRWRHPVLGTVLPAELLPVADKLALAVEIGEWALHRACQQAAKWRREGHDLWLAVNVSVRQLTAPEFVPEVAAALSVQQSPPERLTIEIAEGELAEADLAIVTAALSRLRALGVRTALDDFGAGATDLARLRRLPLDQVKLCPSVVAALGEPAGGPADGLPAAMLDLAGRFQLTVVAEGVEQDWQRQRLLRAGCRFGQGFGLAAPVPARHLEWYLERQQPAAP